MAPNKALFRILMVAAILVLAYVSGERRSGKGDAQQYEFSVIVSSYSPGDVYSVKDEHGFQIVKVLADGEDVLHIRIYKNMFSDRPGQADQIKSVLEIIKDPDRLRIDHMPISKSEFSSWQPEFIAHSKVTPEELEAYQLGKH